jgi:hypothetical protein
MLAPATAPRAVFFIDGFNLYHSLREAENQLPDEVPLPSGKTVTIPPSWKNSQPFITPADHL